MKCSVENCNVKYLFKVIIFMMLNETCATYSHLTLQFPSSMAQNGNKTTAESKPNAETPPETVLQYYPAPLFSPLGLNSMSMGVMPQMQQPPSKCQNPNPALNSLGPFSQSIPYLQSQPQLMPQYLGPTPYQPILPNQMQPPMQYPQMFQPPSPSHTGLVPGIPGIVSQDGGINILPFSDVYSDLLEKHRNKMIRKEMERVVKKYRRFGRHHSDYYYIQSE